MTTVFIENVLGSGQTIKVLEDFGGSMVERTLKPGENARIIVSQFKSVTIDELAASPDAVKAH